MNSEKAKKLKRIWNIFTTVLVVIVVLSAIFLMGTRIIGLKVYTVISGSMKPTYNEGDLIYVKYVEPEEVEIGDTITFVLNEDLVVATHRVVRIDTESQRFYTKGDNNQIEDINPVHFKNLIGKPVFSIPYLGYLSEWVQSPPGLYIALAVGVILLAIVFLPDMFIKAKQEENKKNEEKQSKENQ